ncbi:MAG: hypothetical protein AAGA56_12425 [Myxococcota bacterium]
MMRHRPSPPIFLASLTAALCAFTASCGSDESPDVSETANLVLSSVVVSPNGDRTTYIQAVDSLDDGPFTNENAVEIMGNAVLLADSRYVFVGAAEGPFWQRYELSGGQLTPNGRLSLGGVGASRISFGNTLVDDTTAVSVLSDLALAVVWNPSTMEITGEIPLDHLRVGGGFVLETFTTSAHDGLVYIPGRFGNLISGRVRPGVITTIVDPKTLSIVGVADDDRCTSGGRVVFDEDGYGYVMGDGRNYSTHVIEQGGGPEALDNCILRIPPGGTDFEEDYYYSIPSLADGRQSITELETAADGSGLGFAKMFYPEMLPEGVGFADFAFWDEPAHKMWRIVLADPPTAAEVRGIPFSTVGFVGQPLDGKLYTGESPDARNSDVYEIDPETNQATLRFQIDGLFNGLFRLGPAE